MAKVEVLFLSENVGATKFYVLAVYIYVLVSFQLSSVCSHPCDSDSVLTLRLVCLPWCGVACCVCLAFKGVVPNVNFCIKKFTIECYGGV